MLERMLRNGFLLKLDIMQCAAFSTIMHCLLTRAPKKYLLDWCTPKGELRLADILCSAASACHLAALDVGVTGSTHGPYGGEGIDGMLARMIG